MNVIVDPNLKKVSERINPNGDIINPRTKEIITPNLPEYVEPIQTPANVLQPTPQPVSTTLSIQQQIEEAKKNLAQLEELKKLKIAQMKAEIELLEQ